MIDDIDMIEDLKTMLKKVVKDKELMKLAARKYRMIFDALVKEGFSEEQAMEILSRQESGIQIN